MCCGQNHGPKLFHWGPNPPPSVMAFGDWIWEVVTFRRGPAGGRPRWGWCPYKKRYQWYPSLCLSLSLSVSLSHEGIVRRCHQEARKWVLTREPNWPASWCWTPGLQSCEKMPVMWADPSVAFCGDSPKMVTAQWLLEDPKHTMSLPTTHFLGEKKNFIISHSLGRVRNRRKSLLERLKPWTAPKEANESCRGWAQPSPSLF